MDFFEYQTNAKSTAIYPREAAVTYPLIGLAGEVGEILNKYKKTIRDSVPVDKEDMESELGDVLWYLAQTANDLGISLDSIAGKNIRKLADRAGRGKIQGSGDHR